MEGKNSKAKKADSKVQNQDLINQLKEQTKLIMKMENEAKVNIELVKKSEEELNSKHYLFKFAKADLKEAKKSLQEAEETAKVNQLELSTIKESFRKAKEDLKTEKESNKRLIDEVNTLKQESSETVECSTQTDEQEKLNKFEEVSEDKEIQQEKETDTVKSKYLSLEKLKNIQCKYVCSTRGCTRGTKCWFSHDKQKEQCKFWLKDKCKYGNNCRNIHGSGTKTETNAKVKLEQVLTKETSIQEADITQQAILKLLTFCLEAVKLGIGPSIEGL